MIGLLQVALGAGATPEQRKQAQMKMLEYRAQQPVAFIKENALVFASDVDLVARQGAYAILRRSLIEKTSDGKGVLWELLSPEDNLLVKNQLLNSLINTDRVIKRSAADLVATICNIELPKGRWPEILGVLTNNTNNSDREVVLSAIMTLGSLCELMKERGTNSGISRQQTNDILSGIILGMRSSSPEIRDTSVKALGDSMEFMKTPMMEPECRKVIFLELIKVQDATQEQMINVLKTLAEFVRINYAHLQDHLEPIFNLTMPLIKNPKNDEICSQAMEIWDTLATQYNQRRAQQPIRNYLDRSEALLHLTDALLANLCYVSEDDEDFENSVRGAAYRTLYSIGMMCADQIFERVLDFVAANIGHQDWKKRQASLRAFCTLLEGADTNKMRSSTLKALLEFIRLLDDNSQDVQHNAAFCLNKIAELFPDSFALHPQFNEILEILSSRLSRPAMVSIELCNVFTELSDYAKDQPNQILENWIERLSTALIQNAFRTDTASKDLSLADRSFVAAMNLINHTHNWEFCLKFAPLVIAEFPKTYSLPTEKRAIIQTGLLTLVHSCLLTLESQKRMNISEDVLSSIYNTVIGHFTKIKDVTSDGLYVIGSLSSFKRVPAYLESVWPYVKHGLAKFNEQTMFKAALGAVVDLARNNSAAFGQPPYIHIMADLLKALKMAQIDKELKLSIFTCIGDIIIFARGSTLLIGYLKDLMDVLVMGYQGSLHMAETESEYAESLRQTMVDTTICVVHTLDPNDHSDEIYRNYIKNVFEFVTLSMQLSQKKLTMEFVDTSLLMLIDTINYYFKESKEPAIVNEAIRAPVIGTALNILERNNKRGKYTNTIQFCKHVVAQIKLKPVA